MISLKDYNVVNQLNNPAGRQNLNNGGIKI